MLGCQDFCGYYEWTFHYLRRKFGQEALEKFWRDAIAADSQSHYVAAGRESGLRGLFDCWNYTGESEHCEWTVSLDESQNHLRLDMRECPSKGFLLKNNLNADEDYCDHCIGWIGPALDVVGAEVVEHEHNHCGQCWWRISMKDHPTPAVDSAADIRNDPRWQTGYLDRFEKHRRVAAESAGSCDDPVAAIQRLFAEVNEVVVVGHELAKLNKDIEIGVIFTDQGYLNYGEEFSGPSCIVLGYDPEILSAVAKKWLTTAVTPRPMLLHSYLPSLPPQPFMTLGLPRPLPYLPLLIRSGTYRHQPQDSTLPLEDYGFLLAAALKKRIHLTELT